MLVLFIGPLRHLPMYQIAETFVGLIREGITAVLRGLDRYLEQFRLRIILEMEGIGEAGLKTFIRLEQLLHLVRISGEDDDHVRILFSQLIEETIQRFRTKIPFVIRIADQGICLIHKEDVAMRLLQRAFGILLGITDVLADEFLTIDLDYMSGLEDAQRSVYLS